MIPLTNINECVRSLRSADVTEWKRKGFKAVCGGVVFQVLFQSPAVFPCPFLMKCGLHNCKSCR